VHYEKMMASLKLSGVKPKVVKLSLKEEESKQRSFFEEIRIQKKTIEKELDTIRSTID